MKIIKLNIGDEAGFNALSEKVHNYLVSKIGVNGFKYSATTWALYSEALTNVDEGKIAFPIDDKKPRYNLILESLSVAEIAMIEDVDINWNTNNL